MYAVGEKYGFWKYVAPSPRYGHAMVCFQDSLLYLIGGCGGSDIYLNDVHIYDVVHNRWFRPISSTASASIAVSSSCILNSAAIPSGSNANSTLNLNTEFISSANSAALPRPPPGRACHSAVIRGEQIYVFGGKNIEGELSDLYIFNLKLGWVKPHLSSTSGPGPTARSSHCACMVGPEMFIFGGKDDYQSSRELFSFNTERMEWTQLTPHGPMPRCFGQTACVLNDRIVSIPFFTDCVVSL